MAVDFENDDLDQLLNSCDHGLDEWPDSERGQTVPDLGLQKVNALDNCKLSMHEDLEMNGNWERNPDSSEKLISPLENIASIDESSLTIHTADTTASPKEQAVGDLSDTTALSPKERAAVRDLADIPALPKERAVGDPADTTALPKERAVGADTTVSPKEQAVGGVAGGADLKMKPKFGSRKFKVTGPGKAPWSALKSKPSEKNTAKQEVKLNGSKAAKCEGSPAAKPIEKEIKSPAEAAMSTEQPALLDVNNNSNRRKEVCELVEKENSGEVEKVGGDNRGEQMEQDELAPSAAAERKKSAFQAPEKMLPKTGKTGSLKKLNKEGNAEKGKQREEKSIEREEKRQQREEKQWEKLQKNQEQDAKKRQLGEKRQEREEKQKQRQEKKQEREEKKQQREEKKRLIEVAKEERQLKKQQAILLKEERQHRKKEAALEKEKRQLLKEEVALVKLEKQAEKDARQQKQDYPKHYSNDEFSDGKGREGASLISSSTKDSKSASCSNGLEKNGDLWVECALCGKWRRLQSGSLDPSSATEWECSMNDGKLYM